MSAEQNKALVRKWFEAIDTGDVSIVADFVAPDYVDHNPPPFPVGGPGLDGVEQTYKYALNAFGEFRHVIDDMLADGDKVITRVTATGRHTGDFVGIPPTGKEVSMSGIAIHRIADGKLAEHWGQVDAFGLLVQLGAVPAPPS
jgi:steroid delta-isomerase-like uncharacterized protein